MIRYVLICGAGHEFESWFSNSKACDAQMKRKLVACPVCGSTAVEKAIMAPSLVSPKGTQDQKPTGERQPAMLLSDKDRELRAMLKTLHAHVKQNAEHVGGEFPKLAREMHYGEIEKRSIYGDAKPEEVRSLIDEGVDVHPLPVLPDERN
ncbi:MAG TPA: DUF1178 family protein [Xanthobacteraceae bacterium]|nr:DUF1178 family protein [Xanthobacteraceae bacterium]